MTSSRFTWGADNAPQLFASVGAAEQMVMQEMIRTAAAFGFDTVQAEGGGFLCGKAATAQLVAVKRGGNWEYRDAETGETEGGQGTVMLHWFLQGR